MLNIIIRTSYRPAAFARCFNSIIHNLPLIGDPFKITVGYDNQEALSYLLPKSHLINLVDLTKEEKKPGTFFYNRYLNRLLKEVDEGHVIFLDDDDQILNGSLVQIQNQLVSGKSYLIPFLRNSFQKPTPLQMKLKKLFPGYVGLPCLILDSSHRSLISFDDTELSDYKAIKMIEEKLHWLNIPVVLSRERGFGKIEKKS
jgi:hypothetical protein